MIEQIESGIDRLSISKEDIDYRPYDPANTDLLNRMITMIASELSEPYSIYTYHYFLKNWPSLCYFAYFKNSIVGVILGKLENHTSSTGV